MTRHLDLQKLIGHPAFDADGSRIGKIGQVYLDDQSGQPIWVTVHTGLFGARESFAPLYGSAITGAGLRLAVSKELVRTAPSLDADGHLGDRENDALYEYYRNHLGVVDDVAGDYEPDQGRVAADTAMTRSEERLRVGTRRVEAGRARLRMYVVTENVTRAVSLRQEELRITREPITGSTRRPDGDTTSADFEIILLAQRPVFATETVPVERVRLTTRTVTEQREITDSVRREQIDEIVEPHETSTFPPAIVEASND